MRTMAQRMQDDEDHRLALCGLTPDVRVEHELEDFEVRAYDFIFAPIRANGGESSYVCGSSPLTFASGRRDPAPHDAKRGQGCVGGLRPASEFTRLGPTYFTDAESREGN